MIRILFIPVFFILAPSVADAGFCIFSVSSAEIPLAFSRHYPEGAPGETSDFSDVIGPLNSFKIRKTASSSGALFRCSPAQFIRPPKNRSPVKKLMGRIPSVFPSTVLRS